MRAKRTGDGMVPVPTPVDATLWEADPFYEAAEALQVRPLPAFTRMLTSTDAR
jgi:hypothetical protein